MTGWPRVDLWKKKYKFLYKKEIEDIKKNYKNFILFNSDFSTITKNYKEGDKCLGIIKNITDYAIFLSVKDHPELDAMAHYKNLSWGEKESELKSIASPLRKSTVSISLDGGFFMANTIMFRFICFPSF